MDERWLSGRPAAATKQAAGRHARPEDLATVVRATVEAVMPLRPVSGS
ncbi:MAG: hypothetical protein GYA57_03060 [Myxococcales bacterium]|nr:hypothetical protein [Myxococcales bacterium]